tara:strand:+ start:230 stop:712 length:483 start_codon:yes stop_codon:yes gene_type:complete
LESRKDQLQKQIIEAIKANDSDLHALLKSQWAHRFGVESLEELENLDISQLNQNPINQNNQRNDQSKDDSFTVVKELSIKEDVNEEKKIKNDDEKLVKSIEVENKELLEMKSNEIDDRENYENKSKSSAREKLIPPKVEALIPLPPKPKYSYLRKWLLRS